MEILLGILIVYIVYRLTRSSTGPIIVKTTCQPHHKWIWKAQPGEEDQAYMICTQCNKTPTEVVNE